MLTRIFIKLGLEISFFFTDEATKIELELSETSNDVEDDRQSTILVDSMPSELDLNFIELNTTYPNGTCFFFAIIIVFVL